MKILHVAASYLPAVRYGGTIVSVHALCKALAARGHDVHVFTTSVDGPDDSNVSLFTPVDVDGVKVWYFPSRFARRIYWSPPMARALAEQVGAFDLVHLHALFVWPVWAAAKAARRAHVPYVIAPRGMLEKALIQKKSRLMKSAIMALVGRQLLERAAAIHVTSTREASEASAFGLTLPPLRVVPNGVDLTKQARPGAEASTAVAGILPAGSFILFIGRVSWKKGLDRLIAALVHAPALRLVIAGNDEEGYRPELEAQAKAAGVSARVTWVGPVNAADKAALLARAQLLVLPSYSENFGNVVLEAMAAGCPVVVTPEVGLAGVVSESRAGCVMDGAPASMGPGLAGLADDPPRLREMGERGRAAALAFGWPAIAEQMERVYEDIVA